MKAKTIMLAIAMSVLIILSAYTVKGYEEVKQGKFSMWVTYEKGDGEITAFLKEDLPDYIILGGLDLHLTKLNTQKDLRLTINMNYDEPIYYKTTIYYRNVTPITDQTMIGEVIFFKVMINNTYHIITVGINSQGKVYSHMDDEQTSNYITTIQPYKDTEIVFGGKSLKVYVNGQSSPSYVSGNWKPVYVQYYLMNGDQFTDPPEGYVIKNIKIANVNGELLYDSGFFAAIKDPIRYYDQDNGTIKYLMGLYPPAAIVSRIEGPGAIGFSEGDDDDIINITMNETIKHVYFKVMFPDVVFPFFNSPNESHPQKYQFATNMYVYNGTLHVGNSTYQVKPHYWYSINYTPESTSKTFIFQQNIQSDFAGGYILFSKITIQTEHYIVKLDNGNFVSQKLDFHTHNNSNSVGAGFTFGESNNKYMTIIVIAAPIVVVTFLIKLMRNKTKKRRRSR